MVLIKEEMTMGNDHDLLIRIDENLKGIRREVAELNVELLAIRKRLTMIERIQYTCGGLLATGAVGVGVAKACLF